MPAVGVRSLSGLIRDYRATHAWTSRRDVRTFVQIGIVAVILHLSWSLKEEFGRWYNFFDMKIYHGAIVHWTQGGELYEYIAPETTLGFTYPPFAALTMLPMALFDTLTAGWLNVALGMLALGFVLCVLLFPVADRNGWSRWFVVAMMLPVFGAIEPVRETLGFGQVNLLLFALIIGDLLALRKGWRFAGIGIGLATAIKLTPALFIVYLLISRQWRTALNAVGAALAVTLGTFVVAPKESTAYWGSVIFQTERVGATDMTPNQSLAGLLARLHDSTSAPGLLWIAFTLVLLAVGLSRAVTAHSEGDELIAFTLVGLTANVVSPISWTHHLVWIVPAIIALLDQAQRRRSASRGLIARSRTARGLREPIWFPALTGLRHAGVAVVLWLLFLVSPIWPYEHQLPAVSHYADGLYGALAENSLIIALIMLVALLPSRPGAEPAFGNLSAGRRVPSRTVDPLAAAVRKDLVLPDR
jgi:alpha-1,2-mannosyltransferase